MKGLSRPDDVSWMLPFNSDRRPKVVLPNLFGKTSASPRTRGTLAARSQLGPTIRLTTIVLKLHGLSLRSLGSEQLISKGGGAAAAPAAAAAVSVADGELHYEDEQ